MKANATISIDVDVLKKIKNKPNFNLSAFVENKLRQALEVGEE